MVKSCRCGHALEAHLHYSRTVRDCSLCNCLDFRLVSWMKKIIKRKEH